MKQKGSSDVKGSLWNHLDKKVLLWHREAPLYLRVYCLYFMCILFDFIIRRLDYRSGFLCRFSSWKGAGYVVLMGHVSVTVSYSSCCLTTETEKISTNENSFIENLAASKYSMWAQRGKLM